MTIYWYRRAAATAVLGAVLAVASACDDLLKPSIRTYKGADIAIGAGLGWTEMVFEAGELQELSVVFTPGALDDLPPTLPGTEFILPLPSDAPTTAFDHIGINWQPEGHPPPMVYTHPHFDVHYYFISVAERDAITPADPSYEAKVAAQPTAEETPPGYVADPMGVPGMGKPLDQRGLP